MRGSIALLAACGLTLSLTACGADDSQLEGDPAVMQVSGALLVDDASLRGAIGGTFGLKHWATEVSSTIEDGNAIISVVVDRGGDAAMAQLTLTDLGFESATGGSPILTCSGEEAWMWDYDEDARNVVTRVDRDGDRVNVEFAGDILDLRGLPAADSDLVTDLGGAIFEGAAKTTRFSGHISFVVP